MAKKVAKQIQAENLLIFIEEISMEKWRMLVRKVIVVINNQNDSVFFWRKLVNLFVQDFYRNSLLIL